MPARLPPRQKTGLTIGGESYRGRLPPRRKPARHTPITRTRLADDDWGTRHSITRYVAPTCADSGHSHLTFCPPFPPLFTSDRTPVDPVARPQQPRNRY